MGERRVEFTQSSRRHRIGHAHVLFVLNTTDPTILPSVPGKAARLGWVGRDSTGRELEVIAADLGTHLLVFHVMPTSLRRNR